MKIETARINDRKSDDTISVSSEMTFQTRDIDTNSRIKKLNIENDIRHLMNNALAHINLFIITSYHQAIKDGKIEKEG